MSVAEQALEQARIEAAGAPDDKARLRAWDRLYSLLGTLEPNGAWMIVEPFAHDKLEDNLNPIGRVFYGASTMVCTPASLSQEVGLGLGAQAGEGRLTKILKSAGFTRVRRAAETPFNIVLEARP